MGVLVRAVRLFAGGVCGIFAASLSPIPMAGPDYTLWGTIAFVVLTILGIGGYSGLFTGKMNSDTAIIFGFVCVLVSAIGGYMFYVNSLLDARSAGKKKK